MKKSKKILIIIIVIVAVLALVVVGIGGAIRNSVNNSVKQSEKFTVVKGSLSLTAVGSGKIVSSDVKTVFPTGNVSEILVSLGDLVKKGDVLAVITDALGNKKNFVSDYEGVVTAIPSSGDLLKGTAASSQFEISSTSGLQIDIKITEKDIFKIKVGQKASVYVEALDVYIDGEVKRVSYAGNTTEDFSTYVVTISFNKGENNIFLGMTGSAKIEINTKNDVFKVPVDSIIEDNGKKYVLKSAWLSNMNAPKKDYYIEIQTGLSDTDYVEITKGITESVEIVIIKDDATRFPMFFRNQQK